MLTGSTYASPVFSPAAATSTQPNLLTEENPSIDASLHLYTSQANQQLAVETYFMYCHNQPYSFFHEPSFRAQQGYRTIPQYLLYALLAITMRYTHVSSLGPKSDDITQALVKSAMRDIVAQCFDSPEGPDYRTVQAMTILAIHEFIGRSSCSGFRLWS